MKIKKHILLLVLLALHFGLFAQIQSNPPVRHVISTTGGSGSFPTGTLDYTVGEPMVETYTPGSPFTVKTLTQGFQQPTNTSLIIQLIKVNSTCIGANNGSAAINVLTATGPVTYNWAAPINQTTSFVTNLAPGTYYYSVSDGTFTINDSVVMKEDQGTCVSALKFYTGITPNGDGYNDFWTIEGILEFPDNTVSIYNRWGDLVWKNSGYNNADVVWDGHNSKGVQLPDATYFYVVEFTGHVYKGWVELTH